MIQFQRIRRSGGSRSLAAGILLLVATPALGGLLDADPPITEVVVQGNQTTDEALVLRTLGIPLGERTFVKRLRDRARALWNLGLFSDLKIHSANLDQGAGWICGAPYVWIIGQDIGKVIALEDALITHLGHIARDRAIDRHLEGDDDHLAGI